MSEYNYNLHQLPKLELDKNRFRIKQCPCGKSNRDGKFVPYVGYENYGYCHSCGETFLPELPKVEQWTSPQSKIFKPRPLTHPKPNSIIPVEVFKKSLQIEKDVKQIAGTNHFVKYLINLFGVEVACEAISRYYIGTSNHWPGATVFWQIDTHGKVRTGKIIQFKIIPSIESIVGKDCKRVTTNLPPVYWVHSALKISGYRQCLFGEHLLIDKTKPVAIVESEKTAIIASIYFPQFIWLACGGKDGLNAEKCTILKGRNIVLFPDLNWFENWSNKAKELSNIANFQVSDLLERKATKAERRQGLDLADYLIRFHPQEFIRNPANNLKNQVQSENKEDTSVNYYMESSNSDDIPERPLKPAWGKLKALEDQFLKMKTKDFKLIESLCKTIDKCKRYEATENKLNEIEALINLK